ncbi:uncharacterized protein LOC102802020 [Saccoglossus kowalevskii]|uniref:Netrin receptor UNC5 n=1 Tax=Saccoglossus kowalevskii TaxID=10224 RepID=A0ABM0MDN9_SACKO|nr:PREDICTED: uncharacterized protein LOC102802020 [Saccoglossus kowalevskii]
MLYRTVSFIILLMMLECDSKCPKNCLQCTRTKPRMCLQCPQFLYQSECIEECPEGTWAYNTGKPDRPNNVCIQMSTSVADEENISPATIAPSNEATENLDQTTLFIVIIVVLVIMSLIVTIVLVFKSKMSEKKENNNGIASGHQDQNDENECLVSEEDRCSPRQSGVQSEILCSVDEQSKMEDTEILQSLTKQHGDEESGDFVSQANESSILIQNECDNISEEQEEAQVRCQESVEECRDSTSGYTSNSDTDPGPSVSMRSDNPAYSPSACQRINVLDGQPQPLKSYIDEDPHCAEPLPKLNMQDIGEPYMRACLLQFGNTLRDTPIERVFSTNFTNKVFAGGLFNFEGGNLKIEDTGVNLFIPPGAISMEDGTKQIYIYINLSRITRGGLSGNQIHVTPIVHCGPPGTKFTRPVILRLPHCITDINIWKGFCVVSNSMVIAEPQLWEPLTEQNNSHWFSYEDSFMAFICGFSDKAVCASSLATKNGATQKNISTKSMRVGMYCSLREYNQHYLMIRLYIWNDTIADERVVEETERLIGGQQCCTTKQIQITSGGGDLVAEIMSVEPTDWDIQIGRLRIDNSEIWKNNNNIALEHGSAFYLKYKKTGEEPAGFITADIGIHPDCSPETMVLAIEVDLSDIFRKSFNKSAMQLLPNYRQGYQVCNETRDAYQPAGQQRVVTAEILYPQKREGIPVGAYWIVYDLVDKAQSWRNLARSIGLTNMQRGNISTIVDSKVLDLFFFLRREINTFQVIDELKNALAEIGIKGSDIRLIDDKKWQDSERELGSERDRAHYSFDFHMRPCDIFTYQSPSRVAKSVPDLRHLTVTQNPTIIRAIGRDGFSPCKTKRFQSSASLGMSCDRSSAFYENHSFCSLLLEKRKYVSTDRDIAVTVDNEIATVDVSRKEVKKCLQYPVPDTIPDENRDTSWKFNEGKWLKRSKTRPSLKRKMHEANATLLYQIL